MQLTTLSLRHNDEIIAQARSHTSLKEHLFSQRAISSALLLFYSAQVKFCLSPDSPVLHILFQRSTILYLRLLSPY